MEATWRRWSWTALNHGSHTMRGNRGANNLTIVTYDWGQAGATSVNFEKAGTNSKVSLPLSPPRFFMTWRVSAWLGSMSFLVRSKSISMTKMTSALGALSLQI